MFKKTVFFIFMCSLVRASTADLVLFSYDRPMQLYAFCESVEKYITGLESIQVLYRTSSEKFELGYQEVQKRFRKVKFIRQGPKPERDFKPLLLKAVFDSKKKYILFAVDDIIVTDYVDVGNCIKLMEKEKAYGFYLRLGKNITECYTVGTKFSPPPLLSIGGGVYKWRFKEGSGDWSFVGSVDMTIFRKDDLSKGMREAYYYNPNNFEFSGMSAKGECGLCFEISKIINVPLNIVQEVKWHRNMNFLSTEELLEEFMSGLKIDIKQFYKKTPSAPHSEHIPLFIPRR